MKRIAFAVEKGGTGKTTSAVHVAHALSRLGRTVLLVDTDTQDQCASHLGVELYKPGLAEILLGEKLPREVIVKARERLYLLPSGEKLGQVKVRLMDVARGANLEPTQILRTALSFTLSGNLDYIILDCAPGSDPLLVNVLVYADAIIVPVPPEMQAIRGMMRFFRTLAGLGLDSAQILPTFHDRRVAKTLRIQKKLEEHFKDRLLGKISYASAISEAAGAGMTLFEYQPKQRACEEYQELAKTLDKENA